MNVQPLDDRMIVRHVAEKHKSALLILTDAPPSIMAEVLAVGPGKRNKRGVVKPLQVKVGDIVIIPGVANIFPDFTSGEEFMITEGDVAGIVELGEN
jgi:chaperonin GroES